MNNRLETINASAYQYQKAVQDQFQSICEPLFKLGVKHFLYGRAFQNGSYLLLINDLDSYIKAYIPTIKGHGKTFAQQMNNIERGKSYYHFLDPDIKKFKKENDPIIHLMHDFNIGRGVYSYKGSGTDFIEFYHFIGGENDSFFNTFCFNNIVFLEHFYSYFNEKASNIIDCQDKNKLALFKETFDFYNAPKEELLNQKINQFLQTTQLNRIPIKGKYAEISLSKREVECLSYLSSGKTCKEIGRILDLAPRTVEAYFNNAKEKAGYDTRTELLTNFVKHAPSLYFDCSLKTSNQQKRGEPINGSPC